MPPDDVIKTYNAAVVRIQEETTPEQRVTKLNAKFLPPSLLEMSDAEFNILIDEAKAAVDRLPSNQIAEQAILRNDLLNLQIERMNFHSHYTRDLWAHISLIMNDEVHKGESIKDYLTRVRSRPSIDQAFKPLEAFASRSGRPAVDMQEVLKLRQTLFNYKKNNSTNEVDITLAQMNVNAAETFLKGKIYKPTDKEERALEERKNRKEPTLTFFQRVMQFLLDPFLKPNLTSVADTRTLAPVSAPANAKPQSTPSSPPDTHKPDGP